jgi:hypothetical protein
MVDITKALAIYIASGMNLLGVLGIVDLFELAVQD